MTDDQKAPHKADAPRPTATGVEIRRFGIDSKIAGMEFGALYRSTDTKWSTVAVKILKPDPGRRRDDARVVPREL